MKTYTGGCHCKAVRYSVDATLDKAIERNCSNCFMRGLILSFVPHDQFTLEKGENDTFEYRFNTKKIGHTICRICGVEVFGYAKGKNDVPMVAINLRTVDDLDLKDVTINPFEGKSL